MCILFLVCIYIYIYILFIVCIYIIYSVYIYILFIVCVYIYTTIMIIIVIICAWYYYYIYIYIWPETRLVNSPPRSPTFISLLSATAWSNALRHGCLGMPCRWSWRCGLKPWENTPSNNDSHMIGFPHPCYKRLCYLLVNSHSYGKTRKKS